LIWTDPLQESEPADETRNRLELSWQLQVCACASLHSPNENICLSIFDWISHSLTMKAEDYVFKTLRE